MAGDRHPKLVGFLDDKFKPIERNELVDFDDVVTLLLLFLYRGPRVIGKRKMLISPRAPRALSPTASALRAPSASPWGERGPRIFPSSFRLFEQGSMVRLGKARY